MDVHCLLDRLNALITIEFFEVWKTIAPKLSYENPGLKCIDIYLKQSFCF